MIVWVCENFPKEMMVSRISQNAHIATGMVIERTGPKLHMIAHKINFSRNLAEVLGVYACFGKMIKTYKKNMEKYIMF